jgi:AMMECR1 domain-containing protein
VILKKDGRSAVFLPEVAKKYGWTREQTLNHLAHKAGLANDAWKQDASFQTFRAQSFSAPLLAD